MPRIPIAQIPNAPRGAGAGPLDVPRVSGREVSQTYYNAAKAGQRETMALDAFSGEEKGAMAIAKGVGDFAGVIGKIAERRLDAQNDIHIMEAQNAMKRAWGEQQKEMESGVDPAEWGKNWTGRVKSLEEQFQGDKRLSPDARHAINMQLSQWSTNSGVQIETQATKATFGRAQAMHMEAFENALQTGNEARAMATLHVMKQKNYVFDEQVPELERRVHNVGQFNSVMSLAKGPNPEDAETLLKDADNLTINQKSHIETQIEQQKRSLVRTQLETADAMIRNGTLTDPEKIKDMFPRLDFAQQEGAKRLMQNIAKDILPDNTTLNQMRLEAAAYDPAQDPKLEKFDALMNAWQDKRGDQANEVVNMLKDKRSAKKLKPDQEVQGKAFSQLQAAFRNNAFGAVTWVPNKDGSNSRVPAQTPENDAISLRMAKVMDEYNDWAKKNPEDASSYEKANEWVSKRVLAEMRAHGPKPEKPWWDFGTPLQATPPSMSDVMRKDKLRDQQSQQKSQLQQPEKATEITDRLMSGGKTSQLDDSLIDQVKGLEGFNPNAYGDFKQTSIGYGTRAKSGEKSISQEEADKRLRAELSTHAARVDEAAKKRGWTLTKGQRDALISFDFNTGKGANLLETSDDIDEVKARMSLYNKVTVNGKKVENEGLKNRRRKELEMFDA